MNEHQSNSDKTVDLGPLESLTTTRAQGFDGWLKQQQDSEPAGQPKPVSDGTSLPFDDEREYRLCRQVIDHPLNPSSRYASLTGIKANTAAILRRRLVDKGLIRERTVNSNARGRSSILLEALPAGAEAVARYESRRKGT